MLAWKVANAVGCAAHTCGVSRGGVPPTPVRSTEGVCCSCLWGQHLDEGSKIKGSKSSLVIKGV